jgi:hypothetical protein
MSHDDLSLEAVLHEYAIANMDWSDDPRAIRDTVEAAKTDSSFRRPTENERASLIGRVLAACGKSTCSTGDQMMLFAEPDEPQPPAKPNQSVLFDIVRTAYRSVHEGWSSDRLIADPDMDARFIQACWRLGAQAPQSWLNHLLMNARKRKILGKTEGAMRYHVDPAVMDQYLFASEFAARILQDRAVAAGGKRITVDHILCDPDWGREFDTLAKAISPGFTSLDYRWAAFAIRKAQSRAASDVVADNSFVRLGRFDAIKSTQISAVAGFLWIRSSEIELYIGHSQNLKTQIERILDFRVDRLLVDLPLFRSVGKTQWELGIFEQPNSSVTRRDPLKNGLVSKNKPRLNALNAFSKRKGNDNGEERRACSAA